MTQKRHRTALARYVAAGLYRSALQVLDTLSDQQKEECSRCTSILLSPSGEYIVALGGEDGKVYVEELLSYKP